MKTKAILAKRNHKRGTQAGARTFLSTATPDTPDARIYPGTVGARTLLRTGMSALRPGGTDWRRGNPRKIPLLMQQSVLEPS